MIPIENNNSSYEKFVYTINMEIMHDLSLIQLKSRFHSMAGKHTTKNVKKKNEEIYFSYGEIGFRSESRKNASSCGVLNYLIGLTDIPSQ